MNVISKLKIEKDISANNFKLFRKQIKTTQFGDAKLFNEQVKAMQFGSKEANEIIAYCQACCEKMLAKYRNAYGEWVKQVKPIFVQMKLTDEQQLMMLKRQAARYVAVSLTDEHHLYGDIEKIMKEKNTKWVYMRSEYEKVYEGIDKKFPNLFNRIESKRKSQISR